MATEKKYGLTVRVDRATKLAWEEAAGLEQRSLANWMRHHLNQHLRPSYPRPSKPSRR